MPGTETVELDADADGAEVVDALVANDRAERERVVAAGGVVEQDHDLVADRGFGAAQPRPRAELRDVDQGAVVPSELGQPHDRVPAVQTRELAPRASSFSEHTHRSAVLRSPVPRNR